MAYWRPLFGIVALPLLLLILVVQPSPAYQGDSGSPTEPTATLPPPPPPPETEPPPPTVSATEVITGVIGPAPEIDWANIELIQEPESAPGMPEPAAPVPEENIAPLPAPPPAAPSSPPGYITHIVARGDNLSRIAARYGVSIEVLKNLNQLANVDLIHVGQLILVPATATTTEPAAAEPPVETSSGNYLVQRGDTVYKIARRFGTTVQAIAAANNLANPSALQVGQRLHIPGAESASVATPVVVATPSPQLSGETYVVQRGDSVYKIARRFGTTVQALAAANNLSNPSALRVGQVLRLVAADSAAAAATPAATPTPVQAHPAGSGDSAPDASGETYTVQRGDSLYKIARRFGTTTQALAAANNLSNPSALQVGQILRLVNAENAPASIATPPPATPAATATPAPVSDGNRYIVQPGDSLYKIALRFDTTVQALAATNQLANTNVLHIGMQLTIPDATAAPAPTPAPEAQVGEFLWPLQGRLLQYFRYGHPALDIEAVVGTEIVAAAAGVIEFAGWNSQGYGNLTILDHGNGVRTLYAHQSALLVEAGQTVEQGQVIGKSGSTGWSTWPHLHLEIIVNLQRVNPCGKLPGGC
ncbi:MAG: LysM peptidoglycan-binding domain-containing protein [Anaerolineae bacterium]|nr:LysM peptidoglycan-binding domain-containing protein [Anaerolineae bacterium]